MNSLNDAMKTPLKQQPLIVWHGQFFKGLFYPRRGSYYAGEQAEIMRLAFGIPETETVLARVIP